MPEIVLATLNARYLHASFGLRCLRANLGDLRTKSVLVEFTINQRPLEMAEELLALEPRILGLGVYIWNVTLSTELVALLKRLRPELAIVLGGPEVSYEWFFQRCAAKSSRVIRRPRSSFRLRRRTSRSSRRRTMNTPARTLLTG